MHKSSLVITFVMLSATKLKHKTFKKMETQLLSAEKVDLFLGIESNKENYEFLDVTEDCKDVEDFIKNSEAGQCFDLGESEGYVYKIKDENNDFYCIVKKGASVGYYN